MSSKSALDIPTLTLREGTLHPQLAYGTYKVGYMPPSASAASTQAVGSRTAYDCVQDALEVGYRAFECAQFYGNEADVGKALANVDRSELFLISKVWTTTIEQGKVREQLEQTLRDLQTDYLDLYLIHWPVPTHHVTAYKELIALRNEGKIRGIGVSNYAWEDFEELQQAGVAAEDLPLVNQIEINPFLYRKNTIAKFQQAGVVLQSYRSLRDGKAFADPTIVQLASHYGKTSAQILGRWCVQHGFVYLPKSAAKDRMQENVSVFDFALSEAHMAELDALTTPEALTTFRDLYRKCVNRDTSKDGTMEGVKMEITVD